MSEYEIRSFDAPLGAEVVGLDLTRSLDAETRTAVNKAFVDNIVLCFRDQCFETPDAFLAAASNLGEPMPPLVATYRLPGYEAIEELTSEATDKRTGEKKPLYRGGSWHTDHSNLECPPKATTLYAIDIPSRGGDTQFTSMRAAYEALDDDMKSFLAGRRAYHAYLSRRAPRPLLTPSANERKRGAGAWQPMVRRHPETGLKALYLNPMRVEKVEGIETEEETDKLLDALYAHCDRPEFRYSHKWRKGDMLIWDNRSAQHQATFDFDPAERRYLHRIMLKGEAPLLA